MSVGTGLLWFGLALLCFIGVTLVILTGDSVREEGEIEVPEKTETVRPEILA